MGADEKESIEPGSAIDVAFRGLNRAVDRLITERDALAAELAQSMERHQAACLTIVKMHSAALGSEDDAGATRGLVEDVEDMRKSHDALLAACRLLLHQLNLGRWIDDHGHDVRLNIATIAMRGAVADAEGK